MAKRILKIGDTITATSYGGGALRTGIVDSIELCKTGEKYGEAVEQVDLNSHRSGNVVIGYGNYWCYAEQVKTITH